MINREDMLELTRRMTPSRHCLKRVAGAYLDEEGYLDDTFNISFFKLKGTDKTNNLALAKSVPFADTNSQLKEYSFTEKAMGKKDSMWRLLDTINSCGLENDALMEIFYEKIADVYKKGNSYIFVYHGVYDVPMKGADNIYLRESETIYKFIICAIGPLKAEYEPGKPEFGFLYPAFSDRSPDEEAINIFNADPQRPDRGLKELIMG